MGSSGTRSIVLSPSVLSSPRVVTVPLGQSICGIVEMYGLRDPAVEINGHVVTDWSIVPKPEDHVGIYVTVHGGGGKDPLRTLLTIAVVVASAYAPGAMGITSQLGTAVAQGAILTAGMYLVDALAPIRLPSAISDDYADSPTYSVNGGRNELRPFAPVPVILGQHRFHPPLGARAFTELEGNDEYLRMVFVWGYGPLEGIDDADLRIGDTPLLSYSDVEVETRYGYPDDDPISIMPPTVTQEGVGALLTNTGGAVVRTAPAGSDELSVDVIFPRGLIEFKNDGTRASREVVVRIRYREVGTDTWRQLGDTRNYSSGSMSFPAGGYHRSQTGWWSLYAEEDGTVQAFQGRSPRRNALRLAEWRYVQGSGAISTPSNSVDNFTYFGGVESGLAVSSGGTRGTTISWTSGSAKPSQPLQFLDKTTSVIRAGRSWRVDRDKQYEVELYRVTSDATTDQIQDEVNWYVLRGKRNEPPISFPYPLAITSIRIKATDQLQGVIDSLNGDPVSVAQVWDGAAWTDEEPTRNPAALYRWVLMHPANARARGESQIDDAALGDWYEFCEENGYEFNMVRDFHASVWDCLSDIAAAGRASPTLSDGKWSVVIDRPGKPVMNHITPRNSWGFTAEKVFFERPHAFRVRFINEERDYARDERIVYDDGYNEGNATLFETIELRGITNPDLAWKFGRFHIAQARLRPETYTLFQDFEHLVCRRGDKVRVSHDVTLWGSGFGRVKELITDGTDTIGVVCDDVLISEGDTYALRFRLAGGSSVYAQTEFLDAGQHREALFITPIPTVDGPQVGDLYMFGRVNTETVDLIVKRIDRQTDLVAKLTLVDEAPEIYEADQGAIPSFDPGISQPVDITRLKPSAPAIVEVQSGTIALSLDGGDISPGILVSVAAGSSSVRIARYRIRYREQGTSIYRYEESTSAAQTVRISDVEEDISYQIQAQAISIYGIESDWSTAVTESVVGESEPPADVTGFRVNVVGHEAHLSWDDAPEIDLSHYRIKWTPEKDTASWAESVDMVEKVSRLSSSVSVPAMVGAYLIKKVDRQGNESENAAVATTNVSRLAGLNFVESFEQATPDWDGTGYDVEYNSGLGGLVLVPDTDDGLPASGIYEFDEYVDLGAVFTSRLTAVLRISGEDLSSDLYDVSDLYALSNLYGAAEGQYSAYIDVSTTNDDPEDDPEWSDWSRFIVGDYTARAYKFRVGLIGQPPNVTPIVQSVHVSVDMPDRFVRFEQSVGTSGARIEFDPPFLVVPEIGLSVNNGAEGDKYTISNKDETGFDIAFTNGGSPVSRQISGIAQGYGAQEV